ncbi:MAG: hypothetical protein NC912_01470 [Candidatus Omnitrophica bacterium]|nr:hypothetical protein [Candidatus Omnitrophota bacterium]
MFKKNIFFIFLITLFLITALNLLRAQNYPQDQIFIEDLADRLKEVEAKLDRVLIQLENQKQILQKLDLILNTQSQMQQELQVIKVRATR